MKQKLIIILVLLSTSLIGQTTYTGSAFTVAADNVTTSTLNIPDSGNITDVNITVSGSEACGLEYLDMTLQSPYGTIVELTNINTMSGSAFSQTTFDDEASTTIENGSAPYVGSYQPVGPLASIDSEEVNGDWNLVIYHSSGCGSEIAAWSLTITYDSNTPDPPPVNPGITYTGSAFTIAADNVTTSTLTIPDSGNITDVNITVSGSEACGLEYLNLYLVIPNGWTITLATTGTLSGKAFYQTTFDDEATTAIEDGTAPYFGSYQPVNNLYDLNGFEINGDWTLGVYHSSGCGSEITAWSITIVKTSPLADFSATPTSGDVPLTVQFTDQSIDVDGTVVSWSWNFGDGNTSTEQNPLHTYETYSVYDVILSATDDDGMTGTETKEDYITVNYAGPVWYVSNDGDDSGQGTADDPLATIGIAVYNASAGDSILIAQGDYSSVYIDKQLFVASIDYENIDSTVISNTLIDYIEFSGDADGSILIGVSIKNSDTPAVEIGWQGGTDVLIKNCHIMNNQNYAISLRDGSNVTVDNCLITDNNWQGIYVEGGSNTLSISNSTITGNNIGNSEYGSAIGFRATGSTLTITDSEIANNFGGEYSNASAIYCETNGNTLNLDNVTISNNEGDGISPSGQNSVINNVTIDNNTGIGIQGLNNSTLTNSTISNNLSGGLSSVSNVSMQNVIIDGNKMIAGTVGTEGNHGAGIWLITNSTLTDVIIRNNSTLIGEGGGS